MKEEQSLEKYFIGQTISFNVVINDWFPKIRK